VLERELRGEVGDVENLEVAILSTCEEGCGTIIIEYLLHDIALSISSCSIRIYKGNGCGI
jgi:hypothetical protein